MFLDGGIGGVEGRRSSMSAPLSEHRDGVVASVPDAVARLGTDIASWAGGGYDWENKNDDEDVEAKLESEEARDRRFTAVPGRQKNMMSLTDE